MADNGGAPSLKDRIESLKQAEVSARKFEYARYLLMNQQLRDILCFERTLPKNLVYIRLALVFRNQKPEWIVFRLVELGLYSEGIVDSYPTRECRKECIERKGRKCLEYTEVCEDVTKNIEGLMPSQELIEVCRSLGAIP
jgi:predicted nucleotidyltransferase